MDQDIQKLINDLYQEDTQESTQKDVFLTDQKEDDPIQSPPHQTEEKEVLPKQDNKPPYEKLEDGRLDLNADTSQPQEEELTEKEMVDAYIKSTKGVIGQPSANETLPEKKNPLNISQPDKQEELQDKMKEIKLKSKEDEVEAKAQDLNVGYINLKGIPIMPEALRVVPEETSRKFSLICFYYKEMKEIRVAIMEYSQEVQKYLEELSQQYKGIPVRIYLTSQNSMDYAIEMYKALPKIEKYKDDVKILEKDISQAHSQVSDLIQLGEKLKKASVTEILSLVILTAVKSDSSDIHIEAEEQGIHLRFRIDGVLHDIATLDRDIWEKLVSRIKLDAKLKINIKDQPQDGSFSIHINDEETDFRISTLPTAYGESIVMRILYHEKVRDFTLEKLGISDYAEKILSEEMKKPNGMIVVTGPTGSGKTTTLYAALNKLNTEDNKIITIEDPVEYKIKGINQSAVSKDKSYTFAKGLKSIVRQDPDIILVGEIRDKETADIALNAALTGHLVFSTLHTNNAIGAIPRFFALDSKPYLLAPALNVSIAQRLVRRICEHCKQVVEPSEKQKEIVRQEIESIPDTLKHKFDFNLNNLKFYQGKGCKECSGLGYKGQIGIYEIFQITDEIREMILSKDISEVKLSQVAKQNGMITMIQDGILKALQGVTSLDEVTRVV